jgi:hypothetical protein
MKVCRNLKNVKKADGVLGDVFLHPCIVKVDRIFQKQNSIRLNMTCYNSYKQYTM